MGTGVEVGIHPGSHWNNPEPEIVLAINSKGNVTGAALGNDVNLRDFEGRSARTSTLEVPKIDIIPECSPSDVSFGVDGQYDFRFRIVPM